MARLPMRLFKFCLPTLERNLGPAGNPAGPFSQLEARSMGLLLIIVLLVLLFGGGGYYGYNRYGSTGLGGVLGLVIIVLVVLWFMGALSGVHV